MKLLRRSSRKQPEPDQNLEGKYGEEQMNGTLHNRRSVLGIGGAGIGALLGLPLFRASPALASALKMTMGIGLTNDGAPLVFALQREKLLDQAANELGLQ